MQPKDECDPAADLQSHGVGTDSQFCLQKSRWDSLPRAGRSHIALLLCLTREHPPRLTPHPKILRIKRVFLLNRQLVMLPHRPRRLLRAMSSNTDQKKTHLSSMAWHWSSQRHIPTSQCLQTQSLPCWMDGGVTAGTATGHGIEEVLVGLPSDRE